MEKTGEFWNFFSTVSPERREKERLGDRFREIVTRSIPPGSLNSFSGLKTMPKILFFSLWFPRIGP